MAEHTCPVWVGYLLASPLRKWFQDPERILGPYIREGMTVLDIGPGMGFFSLPLARMVGPGGRVVCVDLQEKMLRVLRRRARKAGLDERVETRCCSPESLQIDDLFGTIDFALAFAVVHEVRDPARLLHEVHSALKLGASLLLAEPRGHVPAEDFASSLQLARNAGLERAEEVRVWRTRAVILRKEATGETPAET